MELGSCLNGQGKIRSQQVGHGALFKPVPAQPPFASRIDQPRANQGLRHFEDLDAAPPDFPLIVVDLSQIQHLPLKM